MELDSAEGCSDEPRGRHVPLSTLDQVEMHMTQAERNAFRAGHKGFHIVCKQGCAVMLKKKNVHLSCYFCNGRQKKHLKTKKRKETAKEVTEGKKVAELISLLKNY